MELTQDEQNLFLNQNDEDNLKSCFEKAFGTPRITICQNYMKEHYNDNSEVFSKLENVKVNPTEDNEKEIESIVAEYSFTKNLPYPFRSVEIRCTIPRRIGSFFEVFFEYPTKGIEIWMCDTDMNYIIETSMFLNGVKRPTHDTYDNGERMHILYESWITPHHGFVFSVNERKKNNSK